MGLLRTGGSLQDRNRNRYEVNMCGEFSQESESGTKRVRTVLIRTVSDNTDRRSDYDNT